MTTRDAPDSRVFGPHRGGVFLHPGLSGAPTQPGWCATCRRHRVEQRGQECPACAEREAT